MKIDLSKKNALVGGASKGIGKAIAIQLAESGASVTLLARSKSLLTELVSTLDTSHGQEHHFLTVDYDDSEQLSEVLSTSLPMGSYHILINNTGGPAGGSIVEATTEAFQNAFQRHIVSAQLLTQYILPGMKKAQYGRIINIISTSVKEPIPNLGVSNTIRAAMGNWAKTLATEVGKYGITVNNVLPGYTDTQRLEEIIQNRARKSNHSVEFVANEMRANVPLGRFAQPSETAAAVAFLASPYASYVNGINFPVDGGRTKSL